MTAKNRFYDAKVHRAEVQDIATSLTRHALAENRVEGVCARGHCRREIPDLGRGDRRRVRRMASFAYGPQCDSEATLKDETTCTSTNFEIVDAMNFLADFSPDLVSCFREWVMVEAFLSRFAIKRRSVGHAAGWTRIACLVLSFVLFTSLSIAQISPGQLYAGHAQLEGVGHCTSCHTAGKELSDTKCLDCHTEIQTRIAEKKGYHATVGSKHCAECHGEHHGRDFRIVRLDSAAFDHRVVGFRLEGKHAAIACTQCHTDEKITQGDVQKLSEARRKRTMLGLSSACIGCHQDQHKGQFANECSTCHGFDKWKPAPKFSHDRSRYPLTGKHKTVDCSKCHNQTIGDPKTIRYTHMEFSVCSSCHADPHKGRFQQACSSCHTTEDFRTVSKAIFDHARTRFPLQGKHASLKCGQCHQNDPKAKNASGELGYHITKFQLCANCHADAHGGQFAGRTDRGKCESCHSEEGFLPARFTTIDHNSTRYPLRGAHLGVSCASCHKQGFVKAKSTRQFHWNQEIVCTICHVDIHQGQFAKKMTNGCQTCHTEVLWQNLVFSHDKTRFPLKGKHSVIACAQCHTAPKVRTEPVKYTGTDMVCSACHKDEHEGQFAAQGTTDCSRCHSAAQWKQLVFDHNTQARFSLTGLHAAVPCDKCHPKMMVKDRSIVKYKPLGIKCEDCHSSRP